MGYFLIAMIVFIANLLFFVWFGSALTSINRHLGNIADHAERQTRLLAALANAAADDSKTH
jgi:hypothetical protein